MFKEFLRVRFNFRFLILLLCSFNKFLPTVVSPWYTFEQANVVHIFTQKERKNTIILSFYYRTQISSNTINSLYLSNQRK